jgi:hypothetical protein
MEQLFKAALQKGLSSTTPYDLVGEMGKGVLAYWQGAILNEFPFPIIPATGAISNIGVTTNIVTNSGNWIPAISQPGTESIVAEVSTEDLLREIPQDNNTVEGVRNVVQETGAEILTDGDNEAGPQLERVKSQLPPDNPPYEQNESGEELSDITTNSKTPQSIKCGVGLSYDAKISPNFRLRDLSIGCTFAHKIKAQRGLDIEDIVCNLQNVAVNILEPLKAQFPKMKVNSGFRGTASVPGGVSQHEKGEAVDVQFSGFTPSQYLAASKWVKDNLPFDQFIFEHGNSIWFHISCKRTGAQRKQLLTMYKGDYKPGIKLYYS